MKQFKLNFLIQNFSVRVMQSREIAPVFVAALKYFDTGKHEDIYEPVWFMHGIIVDTVRL